MDVNVLPIFLYFMETLVFFQDIRKHVYTLVCNNFSRSLFKLKPKL